MPGMELPSLLADVPGPLRAAAQQVGEEAYLVGGAVRDLLLGRPVRDWDVVTAAPEPLAQALAQALGSRPVRLRAEPLMFRLPGGDAEIDLVGIEGPGLRGDLARRDFTINALALPLLPGRPILDPFRGLWDLRAGLVRAVSDDALAADPVRLLRAYRLAGELGFRIAPHTRRLVREHRGLLAASPAQRQGTEILKLLDARGFVGLAVTWMERDGLLDLALPCVADMRGIGQGGYHHLDVLGHTLEALCRVDRLVTAPRAVFRASGATIEAYLSRPYARALVRAATALHDVGKPASYASDPEEGMTFYGHDDLGAVMARRILQQWGWPKPLRGAVARLVDIHMRPLQLARAVLDEGQPVTDRAMRHLGKDAGEHLPGLFLLSAADMMAARGRASNVEEQRSMLRLLDEMLSRAMHADEHRRQPRLLTGHDLMRELGLRPGPHLGRLLVAVEEARQEGQIATPEQALALARRLAAQGPEVETEGEAGPEGE